MYPEIGFHIVVKSNNIIIEQYAVTLENTLHIDFFFLKYIKTC